MSIIDDTELRAKIQQLEAELQQLRVSHAQEVQAAWRDGHRTQKVYIDGKWMLFRDQKLHTTDDEAFAAYHQQRAEEGSS